MNKVDKQINEKNTKNKFNFEYLINDTKEVTKSSLIILILVIFGMKIAFYNENFFVIIKTVMSFFWLFVLPGIFVSYIFLHNINSFERFAISFAIGAAILGIMGYYLGIAELHTRYHGILIPILTMTVSTLIIYYKIKNK